MYNKLRSRNCNEWKWILQSLRGSEKTNTAVLRRSGWAPCQHCLLQLPPSFSHFPQIPHSVQGRVSMALAWLTNGWWRVQSCWNSVLRRYSRVHEGPRHFTRSKATNHNGQTCKVCQNIRDKKFINKKSITSLNMQQSTKTKVKPEARC